MPAFPRHAAAEPAAPHPWEVAHAAPEDRALGLELELIELVRRRGGATGPGPAEASLLDAEIERVLAELDEVSAQVSAVPGRVA